MAWTPKQSLLRRSFVFAVCIMGAMGYAWFAAKAYCAQWFADKLDQPSIEKAVALAPQNATYHEQLCRSMIFISQEAERAVDECERASELNPYSSAIWLDLAQAYYSAGNNPQTHAATQKALAIDPTTPDTAWSAANFFLIQGDTPEALHQFSIVLREDPALAPSVLNICWQSLHDLNRIQSILPPRPDVYIAFIKLLLATGDFNSAHQIWSALIQTNTAFDYRQGLFYIDGLLKARAVDQADEAWKQLLSRSQALQAYGQPNNLIMDGSFTQEILNSGFDWRYNPASQIAVTLDNTEFHSGDRSLKLVYSESGGDAGIFQYIAVRPGMRYRLSAWVKSEDIETANGPVLTVLDGYSKAVYGSTEETTGTVPWHRLETEFETGPEAKLLILAIQRHPGETRIQGKFWVDDIKLEPM
jgi:tetratricopeptide (TPR) repeat protein